MSTPEQPSAGWYPDPSTPGILRFWDGTWHFSADSNCPGGCYNAASALPTPPRTPPLACRRKPRA